MICLILWPNSVSAQQVKLTVIPPQVQILMKSSVSLIKAFNFENLGDPGIFSLRVVSFVSSGDQGNLKLLDKAEGPLRFSLENSNLNLGDRFFLKGGQLFQAILKIRAVANAPEGDYYYTLLMISEPPVKQTSVGRGSAILGANILISVTNSGFTPSNVQIAQFQIIPRYRFKLFGKTFLIVEPFDEVPVILKLANTGNYLVAPQATINLQGPFGVKQKAKLLSVNVLRSSERLLTKRNLDECERCQTQPSAVFHGRHFGKYRISADIGFTGINQKIFANSEFWALPIKLTKIVLGLFLLFAVLLYFLKSKLKHE